MKRKHSYMYFELNKKNKHKGMASKHERSTVGNRSDYWGAIKWGFRERNMQIWSIPAPAICRIRPLPRNVIVANFYIQHDKQHLRMDGWIAIKDDAKSGMEYWFDIRGKRESSGKEAENAGRPCSFDELLNRISIIVVLEHYVLSL